MAFMFEIPFDKNCNENSEQYFSLIRKKKKNWFQFLCLSYIL